MKLLLIGNYGAGNVGDEALREYFLQRFPEHEWTVVSASPKGPEEVPRLPLGVRSAFRPWWKTLVALWRCHAVVFGGGSLFTDVESIFACVLWAKHAAAAMLFGKPRFFAFQGIGPFRTPTGRCFARCALKRAAFISVRDNESAARVRELTGVQPIVTADPVTLLFPRETSTGTELVIIPRANSSEEFLSAVRTAIAERHPSHVRVVLLQPEAEQGIAHVLRTFIPEMEAVPVRSLGDLIAALRGASFVLTQRYHGALAALMMGIPYHAVAQKEGDKLSTLCPGETDGTFRDHLLAKARVGEARLHEALMHLR